MKTRTKVVLILVVIFAQLAWLARPRISLHGEVLEEALKLPANGPIGLEADRDQMEYRKIRLKEIK